METADAFARLQREVEELHAAFAIWMGPGGPAAVFARFEAAFAADFTMVGPDGQRRDRAAVLTMLRDRAAAFGAGFAIAIANPHPIAIGGDLAAIGYDEIQSGRPGPTRRRATALLRQDPAGPNRLRWLAVQETWIADP